MKPVIIPKSLTSLKSSCTAVTWTCCFCILSMLGSVERGPRTLIINSFSESHWRSCGSAVWKTSRLRLDSSRCCFLSTTEPLMSAQAASDVKGQNSHTSLSLCIGQHNSVRPQTPTAHTHRPYPTPTLITSRYTEVYSVYRVCVSKISSQPFNIL